MSKHLGNIVSILVSVAINQPYSYRVPHGLQVKRGSIVLVPLGTKKILGVVWGEPKDNKAHNRLRDIEHIYDCAPLSDELMQTIDWVANYTLASKGMLLRSVLRSKEALEQPKPIIAYQLAGKKPAQLTKARNKVLKILADGMAHSKAALIKQAGISASVIDGLLKYGTIAKVEIPAPKAVNMPDPDFAPLVLSDEQKQALKQLRQTKRGFAVTLLDGVTGGGKTEIFFERVADILRAQKQVLILLPEIALTHTFIERFTKRFGTKPAQWHSEMTKVQRSKIWRGVMDGSIRAVIGARSALFLPFSNLGLIVLDEEHDAAYKQSDGINYHARDMAVIRAKFANAKLILSSATPSIESRNNANIGKYKHVRLNSRFANASMPDVKLIDMRQDGAQKGKWISPILVTEIEKTLARGEQALLFLNRRGYAPLTLCRACGYKYQCPNCSAWLVEHRFANKLMCHHCALEIKKPLNCAQCNETDSLVAIGPGIERIAEEAKQLFPKSKQVVLSSDVANSSSLKQKFSEIEQGKYDLIIGTQLVAKGHHFEKLTLVGVLDADCGLAQGDPRAAEKTFQILTQVSGRAGRADKKGQAYLQTYYKDNEIMQALKNHDSEGFYRHELALRKQGHLPPFGRLAALIISANEHKKALDYARMLLASAPKPANKQDLENLKIFGPADAPISIVRGRHRVRLLVQSEKYFDLSSYVRFWLENTKKPTGNIKLQIDIDPVSFH